MAVNKNKRQFRFELNDKDYEAFGRYRIMYTAQGRKMVLRQRITYIISGICIAALFYVFPVSQSFARLAYIVAAVIGIGGAVFAEKLVLRQQRQAIQNAEATAESIHLPENTVRFDDETFETKAGDDVQTFRYGDIKLIDLTEEAIYVWMSDEMIMPIPLHAFRGMDEMKELYKWIKAKIKEQGGEAGDDDK
ncbi:MAG: hypothetical protein IJH62_00465 [Mogibacterium sp.]|nr:hypothetical protein [Mogibacterium sp.]